MQCLYTSMLLLLHSAFKLRVVKMLLNLKEEVGGSALNSHGNYIADHGKSWKNHGIVFLNFCGNPAIWRFRITKIVSVRYIQKTSPDLRNCILNWTEILWKASRYNVK